MRNLPHMIVYSKKLHTLLKVWLNQNRISIDGTTFCVVLGPVASFLTRFVSDLSLPEMLYLDNLKQADLCYQERKGISGILVYTIIPSIGGGL